ncbi:MAG: hydantoinase/carbamoylase family amidase [Alphaproteobacteria bacterium]
MPRSSAGSEGALERAVEGRLAWAERLFGELRERTKDDVGITRAAWGEGEQRAWELMDEAARGLGLEVSPDAAGNLYATLPGRDRAAKSVVVGSHLDSVPKGGNYDGAAGVVGGLMALAALREAGAGAPGGVTVVGFRGEEAPWFGMPYIGSRLALGLMPREQFEGMKRTDTGQPLAECIAALGHDAEALRRGERRLSAENTRAYLELHIEQGPLLEDAAVPLGVATALRGSMRFPYARCLGAYAHAAATPRAKRSDAVLATVELVAGIDRLWQGLEAEGVPDLVFTVGKLFTDPHQHAMTKIPGVVSFTLNFGGTSKAHLDLARARILALAAELGARRRVRFELGQSVMVDPSRLDGGLRARFHEAAGALGVAAIDIATVGHDAAMFLKAGIPAAVLLVRNQHGSHNAEEAMAIEDFGRGVKVLAQTLAGLA